MRRFILVMAALVGCVDPAEDMAGGGGKADGNGSCDEPQYGDGICHFDLACGIPDVDCFMFFADDAEAVRKAEDLGDAVVNASDPLTTEARDLIDRTWDNFRGGYPLAELADKHLAVVVTARSELAASVNYSSNPGIAYFGLYISAGLLNANLSDETMQAIVIHELGHLVKGHASPEVVERIRRYYVAPAGKEPIGALASDSTPARDAFTTWQKAVTFSGMYVDPQLAGLPYGGTLHKLINQYLATVKPSSCAGAATKLRDMMLTPTVSVLDQKLLFAADHQAARQAAIKSLKDCVAGDTTTFGTFRAMFGAFFATELTAADARFDTMRVFDGLLALSIDRQAKLSAQEAAFATRTGRPWDALRYFSAEEQADDLSVRIAKASGITPDALGGFFATFLGDKLAACEQAIASGAAPYGRNLLDDHHSNCWRLAHVRQLAAGSAVPRFDAPALTPWIPTNASILLRSH